MATRRERKTLRRKKTKKNLEKIYGRYWFRAVTTTSQRKLVKGLRSRGESPIRVSLKNSRRLRKSPIHEGN